LTGQELRHVAIEGTLESGNRIQMLHIDKPAAL